jgi:hypothetical protein
VFAHARKMGLECIVSDSAYRSGRSPDSLEMKNSNAPAVKREEEEDWAKRNGVGSCPIRAWGGGLAPSRDGIKEDFYGGRSHLSEIHMASRLSQFDPPRP